MPGPTLADFMGAAHVHPDAAFKLDRQGGQDQLATSKSTLGNRFVNVLRDTGIIRTKNPAMVAFKDAIRWRVGDDRIADELFNEFGLKNHKPLTERTVARAAGLTAVVGQLKASAGSDARLGRENALKYLTGLPERIDACRNNPLFARLGEDKFKQHLLSFDKSIAEYATIASPGVSTDSLTDVQKVALQERVEACSAVPMFSYLGPAKFTAYLTQVEKNIRNNSVEHLSKDMPDVEKVALYGYMSGYTDKVTGDIVGDYQNLNAALRAKGTSGAAISTEMQDYVDHATKALARLPELSPGLRNRMASLPPDADKLYMPGARVTEHAFVSTSAGSIGRDDHNFKISGRSGKDVSGFSSFPHEKEVLFPPGLQFKVLDRMVDPDGGINITMVEV